MLKLLPATRPTSLAAFIAASLLVRLAAAQPAQDNFWNSRDAYLGQKPPSDTPIVFAPGMLADPGTIVMDRIAIAPDGKEIFCNQNDEWYSAEHAKIKGFRFDGQKWIGPTTLAGHFGAPSFSMDGQSVYLTGANVYEVWQSTRTANGWSAPAKYLGKPFALYEFMATQNGTCYMGTNPDKNDSRIGRTAVIATMHPADRATTTRSLGIPVNEPGFNGDFFIARDESFLLISAKETSEFECQIFISYHKPDGTWTNPKSLGPNINDGVAHRWGEFVTPDNKYLFYSHGTSPKDCAIYWVRFDVLLERLRHTNFEPYVKNQVADQTLTAGKEFSLPLGATFFDDDGNNTLSLSATLSNGDPLPQWLEFDPSSKTVSGMPPVGPSYYRIAVTATDPAKAAATCRFYVVSGLETAESGQGSVHDFTVVNKSDWVIPENDVLGYDFEDYEGRPALLLKRRTLDGKAASLAYPRALDFRDGTIEFDAASPGGDAGYLGLAFRIKDDHHYETLYFRPGASDSMNAIQYMPEKKAEFNWPDYEDLKYQALATLPLKGWFHVKVLVRGRTVVVFVNHQPNPAFVYDDLDPSLTEGSVGFWLGNSPSGAYRNLVVTEARQTP